MLKTLRRKTWGDLKANWKQFLMVWLVVVMGVTFYGAMYPSGMSLTASIYNTYEQLAFMDFQVKLEPASSRVVKKLAAVPGVATAEGRLVVESGVALDPASQSLTSLRLISIPDDGEARVNRSEVLMGRLPQGNDEILLLKRFADHHGIKTGDWLKVWVNGHEHMLRVAGLAFNPEYLIAGRSPESPFPTISSFGVAWVRYSALAKMAELKGLVNEVVLRLDSAAVTQPEALRPALEAVMADYEGEVVHSRVQTPSGGIIDANVNGNFSALAAFSALFLFGGTLITSVLLGRVVEGDRRRIGTLRALGVSRGELAWHYLTFGLLIGLSGALVGSVLGYFTSFLTMYPFIATIAGGYLPGFVNAPQVKFILFGFVVATLSATLSGAFSAWRESGTPPGIALRPPSPQSPSVVSRIPLGGLPLTIRQALRNLLRVPGRSFGTALGVMAGAVMVFSSLALLNTIDVNFEAYYATGRYDLRAELASLQPSYQIETDIKRIDGVQEVQPALIGPVTASSSQRQDFATVAVVVDETRPYLQLITLEGQPAFSSRDGVWIGHNLQRVLRVQVGDTLTLKAVDKDRQVQVLGVVSQVLGSPVFVPRSLMTEWLPGKVFLANMALVRVEPGQAGNVRSALADLPEVTSVENYPQFVADLRAYLQYWRSNSLLFAVFGCLLTLVVILNTVNAGLHEQQGELAILRSLGVRQGEIAMAVMLELLIMAASGVIIGVPLGREIGFRLIRFYDTDFYGLSPAIYSFTYVAGIAILVLVVMLAALPGLAAVQRLDLGQVSKSQSI